MKMKAVLILSLLYVVILRAKAWQAVKNPFEFIQPQPKIHTVSDCMYVTSEEGEFVYVKKPQYHNSPLKRTAFGHKHHSYAAAAADVQAQALNGHDLSLVADAGDNGLNLLEDNGAAASVLAEEEHKVPDMDVCGIYFITDPNKIVEITVKYLDVNCETGGLMGFVDGWELNGQYFPSAKDHQLTLEERVDEFCNDNHRWPLKTKSYRKVFKSNQNAALLQYRIPIRGSFVIRARYLNNPEPCNIMAEGVAPYYTLKNYGSRNNCTLTALFPAVVSVVGIHVGDNTKSVDYDCKDKHDNLEVGGSPGIDSFEMMKSVTVCGKTGEIGPEQAIFCGATSVRLQSSGNYNNQALISIRTADENDLNIATVVCEI